MYNFCTSRKHNTSTCESVKLYPRASIVIICRAFSGIGKLLKLLIQFLVSTN